MSNDIANSRFLSQLLVTDTMVYEVIGRSPKTLTLRTTGSGDKLDSRDNGSPYPVVYSEAISDESGRVFVVRLRKDGTYRVGNYCGANPLRPAKMVDGKPVTTIDYSF